MNVADHNLLLIDADPYHARALEEALIVTGDNPSTFEWIKTLSSGLERLNQKGVWAIFLNLSLPDSRGVDTFDRLHLLTAVPIVVLGGVDDEDVCKMAMRHGAQDYLWTATQTATRLREPYATSSSARLHGTNRSWKKNMPKSH